MSPTGRDIPIKEKEMNDCCRCNNCAIDLHDKEIIIDNGDVLIDLHIRGKDGWKPDYQEGLYALGRLLDELKKPFVTEES